MEPTADYDAGVGYRRDRSFYASRPSANHTPKIHRQSVTRPGMAACDSSSILLDTDHPIPLVDDPAQLAAACQRCFPLGQSYPPRRVTSPGQGRA